MNFSPYYHFMSIVIAGVILRQGPVSADAGLLLARVYSVNRYPCARALDIPLSTRVSKLNLLLHHTLLSGDGLVLHT